MSILEKLVDDSAFRYGVLMGLMETGADSALKAYAQTNNTNYLAITGTGYAAILYVFQNALRKNYLGRVNSHWNAFTTVSNVIAGSLMGETYSNTQYLGFALISLGIFLI
jgi:multidrug transporter EmrE-like cation transporter